MKTTIQFTATWSGEALRVPPSMSLKKMPVWVEGIVNYFPVRTRLDKNKTLTFSKNVVSAIKAKKGEEITIEITRIGDEPEARIPADLDKALSGKARVRWNDITPMARRDWVLFITTAKKEETRKDRIRKAVDMLSSGKKRVCCFPGLNWMTRDHVKPEETWQPLPKK